MNTYFQQHLSTTRFPLISRLTVCSLLVSCAVMSNAFAEDIVWYGDGDPRNTGTLRYDPMGWYSQSLFADAPSNNRVSVYGDVPGYVYGGVSSSEDTNHNTVNITDSQIGAIAAGRSSSGDTSYNTLTISNSTVSGYIDGGWSSNGSSIFNRVTMNNVTAYDSVWGGYTSGAESSNNSVVMTESSVSDDVIGGYSGSEANNNSVVMTGSTVGSDVIGGRGSAGQASNNSVAVANSTVTGDAIGGMTYGDQSSGNSVTITDSSVGADAVGGYTYNGQSSYNKLTVTNSSVNNDVMGGFTADGESSYNSITMINSTVGGDITGGNASYGQSSYNSVAITDGTISGDVTGGYNSFADANNNNVNINGDSYSIGGMISGGYVSGDNADVSALNNTVNISGNGDVTNTDMLAAGFAYNFSGDADASDNRLAISGGRFYNDRLVGGYASSDGANAKASGNSVAISSGQIDGSVLGGLAESVGTADVTFNSVTLSGNAQFSAGSDIFGGFIDAGGVGDAFTGNALNIVDYHGSAVHDVANFQTYSFTLPASVQNGDTVLTANNVTFGNGSGLDSTVSAINMKSGGNALAAGESVTLISANFTGTVGNDGDVVRGAKGMSLLYDFLLNQNAGSLDATVLSVNANPQTKALSEGRIAGLAFTNQGASLLAGAGLDAAANVAPDGEMSGFALMGGGWSRYDSGSHVDVYGASLLTGFASAVEKRNVRYLGGAFFETGWGGYDSYNSFANMASIDGDGDINYYGGGLLGRIDFGNVGPGTLSIDAAVRAGQTHTDFDSDDLSALAGQKADYKSRSYYVGGHTGISYKLDMTKRDSVKMYMRYLWTRQGSDEVTVAGDPVRFKAINSYRLQTGGHYGHAFTMKSGSVITPFAGVAYEYEFDSKAKGTIHGHNMDTPDIKGGTGIFDAGVSVKPSAISSFSADVGLQGYAGKREGVSGRVQLKWTF